MGHCTENGHVNVCEFFNCTFSFINMYIPVAQSIAVVDPVSYIGLLAATYVHPVRERGREREREQRKIGLHEYVDSGSRHQYFARHKARPPYLLIVYIPSCTFLEMKEKE